MAGFGFNGFGFKAVKGRGRRFTPASLFATGEQGAWYDPSDLSSMFQDDLGTTAAAVDSPVGRINDKSGRGNHATQATAAARPILRQDAGGSRYLEFDGVDDRLVAAAAVANAEAWCAIAVHWTGGSGFLRMLSLAATGATDHGTLTGVAFQSRANSGDLFDIEANAVRSARFTATVSTNLVIQSTVSGTNRRVRIDVAVPITATGQADMAINSTRLSLGAGLTATGEDFFMAGRIHGAIIRAGQPADDAKTITYLAGKQGRAL